MHRVFSHLALTSLGVRGHTEASSMMVRNMTPVRKSAVSRVVLSDLLGPQVAR